MRRGSDGKRGRDIKFLYLAAPPGPPSYWNVLIGYNVAAREGITAKI